MLLSKELVTVDGLRIFPTFLGEEERRQLLERYAGRREFMWCTCRTDEKLYYRVSSDLRIYPEHQGYQHDPACIFSELNKDRAKKAYMAEPETGEVNVYLKFNPENFSETYSRGNASTSKTVETEKDEEQEQFLSLEYFVRDLNVDSYNWRVSSGKGALSSDYFASLIKGRLKSVKIAGKSRAIREYTLERDGYSFFYVTYAGVKMKSKDTETTSYYLKVNGREGKTYSWWIYGNKYERAEKRFEARYGLSPDQASAAGYNVMVAGFLYRRQKKYSNSTYDCIGKIVFFIVNRNGIFCRNIQEKANLDTILSYVAFESKGTNIRYYIADDDDPFDGYFDIPDKGKALICPEEDKELEGRIVLYKDITEDTITKDDLSMLMGRALH